MALGETDHQALYLGTCWAILGLAILLCCARYYVKFFMMRKPTVDDIILFLTILGMVTSMILWTLREWSLSHAGCRVGKLMSCGQRPSMRLEDMCGTSHQMTFLLR